VLRSLKLDAIGRIMEQDGGFGHAGIDWDPIRRHIEQRLPLVPRIAVASGLRADRSLFTAEVRMIGAITGRLNAHAATPHALSRMEE